MNAQFAFWRKYVGVIYFIIRQVNEQNIKIILLDESHLHIGQRYPDV